MAEQVQMITLIKANQIKEEKAEEQKLSLEDLHNLQGKDINEIHYRIFYVLLFTLIYLIMGNLAFFGIYSENTEAELRIVLIIFFSLILIFCIFLLIKACYSGEKLTNYLQMLLRTGNIPIQDKLSFFFYEGLYLLHILLYSIIYGCITGLVFEIFYHDTVWDESKCSSANEHAINCIVVFSTFNLTIPVVVSITMLYLFKTVKCSSTINNVKTQIRKNKMAETIDNKIMKQLEVWKEAKKIESNKAQLITLICIVVVFTVLVQGYIRHDFLSIQYKKVTDYLAVAVAFIFWVIDGLFFSFYIFVLGLGIIHTKFPSIIMNQLLLASDTIHINEPDDIIDWWKLRQFYVSIIADIYNIQFTWSILLSLGGSLIFSTFALIRFGSVSMSLIIMYMTGAVVTAIISFMFVTNAVYFYSGQLLHVNTVNQAKIQLNRNQWYDKNNVDNKDKFNIFVNVMEFVMSDIKENVKSIRVLGIKMDTNFMLFLRATAGTFTVLFITTFTT